VSARRLLPLALVTAALAAAPGAGTAFADQAPAPHAANGKPVTAVATGVPTPTAFAFGAGAVFAASGPNEGGSAPGGLFVLKNGAATRLPGSPAVAFGLAWRGSELFVSTGPRIVALSGWTGTRFTKSRTVYRSTRKGFPGFNGLAFGPDKRLYAGLALNAKYDHAKDPFTPSQAVVSLKPSGKGGLTVVSRGLRQPFQLVFPAGSKSPLVTSLSQDQGNDPVPPDVIALAKPGANFGFPTCTWRTKKGCKGFTKPRFLLPVHSSPMGIGAVGSTLYVSLFGGIDGNGPQVVTLPVKGGVPTPFITGFPAPVIGLGINGKTLYAGDLTGTIYRMAL